MSVAFPKLQLVDIISQYKLLDEIYNLNSTKFRAILFDRFDYNDAQKYVNYGDLLACVACVDEGTRYVVIRRLGSYLDSFKYALSFFWTLRCQLSVFEILFQFYKGRLLVEEIGNITLIAPLANYVCYREPLKARQECVNVLVQFTQLLPDLANIVFLYEDETDYAICMAAKFSENRHSVYKFWLQLDQHQQDALIEWYNNKTTDQVMLHPYYEYSKS